LPPQASDFSGIWKECFKGVHSTSLMNQEEILRGPDPETLNAVFQEWMIRFQKYIDWNGEYVEWCWNWNLQLLFLNGRSWDATHRRNML
jgi:hypothetical protein